MTDLVWKEEPVNLLTDEECAKILELSKRPELVFEGCTHGKRYYGLTVHERKELKEEVEFLETTLKKWIPDLVSFSNFCSGREGMRIRCQTQWNDCFQGVSYFDLPNNDPE